MAILHTAFTLARFTEGAIINTKNRRVCPSLAKRWLAYPHGFCSVFSGLARHSI